MPAKPPIPVILDTDLGTDIDDVWALALVLACPELDLRLATACTGDTTARARLLAKLLDVAGHGHVPVGIGPFDREQQLTHTSYADDYSLTDYPGSVHDDGAQAIVEAILASDEPLTIIAIGPLTNIAAALEREPSIVERARFVGMHGSLRRGRLGMPEPIAEYNVVFNVSAAQAVLHAGWSKTVTPLDTCGYVVLDGGLYRQVRESKKPIIRALMDCYELWLTAGGGEPDWLGKRSSILFDTVAVALAFTERWLHMESLSVGVGEDGFTREEPAGELGRWATEWGDLEGFRRWLVGRLTGEEC